MTCLTPFFVLFFLFKTHFDVQVRSRAHRSYLLLMNLDKFFTCSPACPRMESEIYEEIVDLAMMDFSCISEYGSTGVTGVWL